MQGSSRPDRELLDAAALCAHLVPEGSVHAFLAEHRLRLFPDEMFVDLFPTKRGRPSVPADVIATVMVLQALEGLSDREAVRQLETNIAWKAATGLALTDEAFHSTVLVLWRNKLRSSDAPQRIFDAVRAVIAESKVLAGKHRRALDSTVLDDAVARQDTITMLVTQIRRVRKLIPELGSVWVREHNLEPGRPPCDWDDPADRDRLVSELVDDANELVWAVEDLVTDGLELTEKQADAVALLALVAGQDVEPGDGPGQWRIARRTAEDRVISTVDPEARHAHKTRRAYRDGYKAHVAAEPDTGLVTACDLGPGNVGDAHAAPDLLADEPAGTEVLGDSAYSAGEFRAHLEAHDMTAVIKPPPLRPAVEGGFTLDDFTIDLEAATVTCPEGVTVTITRSGSARFGTACRTCPVRKRCTNARAGRVMVLHPQHRLLAAARILAGTDDFDTTYRQHRPMIERTIAWLVKDNHRRLRYRGTERNRLGWSHRCAAVNLKRLLALGLTHHDGWAITAPV
ncbi:MAG: IS1182 family transposase [Acidimicrobiales bacterium]|nr:IS1182 family transposase [Acidimicrobiales bacterium]